MLQDRINYFEYIFEMLQDTNSRLEKEQIVADILPEYKEDFDYIIECLNGRHPFGYRYEATCYIHHPKINSMTVKEVLILLQTPKIINNLTRTNIELYVNCTYLWSDFFEPIVNRTLKLGIGNSILPKDGLAPMLAKKYEGTMKRSKDGYFVTEKLDGNRCIARFENGKWWFTSRSGKSMNVDFDMSFLPTEYVYDGEILSPEQTELSQSFITGQKVYVKGNFNSTSGLINRHSKDKKLIYNIFDIMLDGATYRERREILEDIDISGVVIGNVRILPVTSYYASVDELNTYIWKILDRVIENGGEGLMINSGSALYSHKRTDDLLKVKKVKTMDMVVIDVEYGSGKYEAMIGALIAEAKTSDGKLITCKIGTGLSDAQRFEWANFTKIIGKIIEVVYFDLSQSSDMKGTNVYSLRFPRLKSVRTDKNDTSEY